ncbi:hypothetical protein [Clostridium beijerinckii]|uniref:hypothetical protein n=1 Tax=Clostridium beijerinckii TaxID=1520 RepID=UPI001F4BDEA4|nr:hypothetical protein [Clostridium beijerinckii]
MFSLKIIDSARFLKMPISSQLLYFHLCMRADDDGVVEGYNVLRMTGVNEDDLRVLSAKGFVKVLNEDLVAYIEDWKEHNKLRADRKVDSIYKDLLLKVIPDVELLEPKKRSDLKQQKACTFTDGQWTDNGQTTDGLVQDSTGQVRTGQERLGQQHIEKILKNNFDNEEIESIRKYCIENNVVADVVVEKIEIINHMKKIRNKVGALLTAIKEDWKPSKSQSNYVSVSGFNNFEPREYDYDSLEKKLLGWDTD